jgi:hypothetical protein
MTAVNLRQYWRIAAGAVLGLLLVAMFARGMGIRLNHDEQQFVAAGRVLQLHGLLPYRDFPFFHTPLLVWIDAAIDSHTDYLLLAGRGLSIAFGWISLCIIFGMGLVLLRRLSPPARWGLSLAVCGLLFVNPVFAYAYFRAWNQSLPLLFMLVAIVCQWRGATTGRCGWFGLSGVALAMAVSTRISYAPLGLPFLVLAWCVPETCWNRRLRYIAAWTLGMAVGSLPALLVIVHAPAAFFFDNFSYNGPVNAAFRGPSASFWPALGPKALFLLETVLHPATLALLAAYVFVTVPRRHAAPGSTYLARLILALLPFAAIGALAPTPSYTQYYCPIVALLVVGLLTGLAAIHEAEDMRWTRRSTVAALVALIIGMPFAIYYYAPGIAMLTAPRSWEPCRMHAEAMAIRSHVRSGKCLTIAPITAMEAGVDIYPPFVTGPFAWRTARFLSDGQRRDYLFVGEKQLERYLSPDPPAAILVGYEGKLEKAFIEYARKHGYRMTALAEGKSLWVKP